MKLAIITINILFSYLSFSQIPSSFDLRNVNGNNYVTSVKNQQGGNSWTHAVCASAESNLLITGNWISAGENGEPDLAEYHIDWWNGFNTFNNDDAGGTNSGGFPEHGGGTFSMANAYLARGEGFVRNIDGQSYNTPPDKYLPSYKFFYVKNIENHIVNENLSGIDTIKLKIMQKGAAASAICYDASFIDDDFNFYQPESSNLTPNHAVSVIGWDDNHSVQAAPANGAWLVKNCWGDTWAENGYFWVSYYDKYLFKTSETVAYFYSDIDTLPYDLIYSLDYHGRQDVLTSADSVFNAFRVKENVRIKAVSFYTESENVDYTIKIDGGYDGNLTHLKGITSGNFLHKGFHTVDFPGNIPVNNGENFYVMLSLSDKKYAYDRTANISIVYGGKSAKNVIESLAATDESFYATSGQWNDFFYYNDPSGFNGTGNFCLKVLANYNLNLSSKNLSYKIEVYPVPASDFIFVKKIKNAFFDIYDISGRLISFGKINENGKINISDIPKGIFILKIYNGKKNLKTKFVKSKISPN